MRKSVPLREDIYFVCFLFFFGGFSAGKFEWVENVFHGDELSWNSFWNWFEFEIFFFVWEILRWGWGICKHFDVYENFWVWRGFGICGQIRELRALFHFPRVPWSLVRLGSKDNYKVRFANNEKKGYWKNSGKWNIDNEICACISAFKTK